MIFGKILFPSGTINTGTFSSLTNKAAIFYTKAPRNNSGGYEQFSQSG
jgi:hypothetical protein